MTIGIDKIGFATSNYVLKLNDLAAARGTDPDKLSKGLLLKELSIAPLTEDIVTLGAADTKVVVLHIVNRSIPTNTHFFIQTSPLFSFTKINSLKIVLTVYRSFITKELQHH